MRQFRLGSFLERCALKRPTPNLSFKLSLLVIGASLLGVWASTALVLSLQRQQLVDTALATTHRTGMLVQAGLHDAMLRNDRAQINTIVQDIAQLQGIEHIRILDARGIVRTSSTPAEAGQIFDYSMPMCQSCHNRDARPLAQAAIGTTQDRHAALLNVAVIRNQAQCASCHDARQTTLGILVIEMPLGELDAQLTASFWRIVFAALVTLVLLIGMLWFALQKLVLRPVAELAKGMTAIHAGNLGYAVRVPSHDELGKLARTFDAMRQQLQASQEENAILLGETRQLAILEERDRLAREMHDNLAQMLGYLKLKTAILQDLVARNEIEPVTAGLLEMKQITNEAYTEVREAIYNLRTVATPANGFIATLEEYLAGYRRHHAIHTELVVADWRLTEFPAEVQAQVNRIIQEALANVRKHSGARHARVRFEQIDHHVQICIEDDGKGFDPAMPAEPARQHYGLAIMRERAQSIGGDLHVDSQPGRGTRIMLDVPLYPMLGDHP